MHATAPPYTPVTPSRVGWPNKAFAEYNRLLVYFNSNMP